jgi:DNA mismatch endonuclease (patch repair protein)
VRQNFRKKTPTYVGLNPASEAASRAKQANRRHDTVHELLLRKEVWRLGLRYRKYVAELPGKPDLVFARDRVVVFCDGDFWHGRNWKRLRSDLARRPNAHSWIAKIARHRQRDAQNTRRLTRGGWLVIRLWETDIIRAPEALGMKKQRSASRHRL